MNYSVAPTPGMERLREFIFRALTLMHAAALEHPEMAPEDMDDLLVGRLIVRECGECVACCVYPSISGESVDATPEVPAKAAGVKCVHCTNTGCGIYARRPKVCKGYACLYSMGVVDERPDKALVAWTLQPDMNRPIDADGVPQMLLVGHCDDIDEVLDDARNRQVVRDALVQPSVAAVTLRSARVAVAFMPDGKVMQVEVNQADALKSALVLETAKESKDWRHPFDCPAFLNTLQKHTD